MGLDLGDKLVVLVVAAGIASALIYVLIKVGEIVVKRRTAALLAEHKEDEDEPRDLAGPTDSADDETEARS